MCGDVRGCTGMHGDAQGCSLVGANMVGYLEFFFFTYAMISLKEPSGLDQGL